MSVLDPEFHVRIQHPVRPIFALAAIIAFVMLYTTDTIGLQDSRTVAPTAATDCSTDAPGCELNWMLENLTDIEHPILVLTPETR